MAVYYPLFKSFVCEKRVVDQQALWTLKNNAVVETFMSFSEEYMDYIPQLRQGQVFARYKELILVQRKGKVVMMLDDKIGVYEDSLMILGEDPSWVVYQA